MKIPNTPATSVVAGVLLVGFALLVLEVGTASSARQDRTVAVVLGLMGVVTALQGVWRWIKQRRDR